jgi:hypothetical protein
MQRLLGLLVIIRYLHDRTYNILCHQTTAKQ